jgi:hypothetical protein
MCLHIEIVTIRFGYQCVHTNSSSDPFETAALGSFFKMFPKKEFLLYKQNKKRQPTCLLTTTLTWSTTNIGLHANKEAMICISDFHIFLTT